MSIQNPLKGTFHGRVGCVLVGTAALLGVSAFPAAAEDRGPSVQGATELAIAQKTAAEAQSAAIKAEADNILPGNIRIYDQSQLDASGQPKPNAHPRPLKPDEIDAKLEAANNGTITLWYISRGYALNEKGETLHKGTMIELAGALLDTAIDKRRKTLDNEAQKAAARAAADIQGAAAEKGKFDKSIYEQYNTSLAQAQRDGIPLPSIPAHIHFDNAGPHQPDRKSLITDDLDNIEPISNPHFGHSVQFNINWRNVRPEDRDRINQAVARDPHLVADLKVLAAVMTPEDKAIAGQFKGLTPETEHAVPTSLRPLLQDKPFVDSVARTIQVLNY